MASSLEGIRVLDLSRLLPGGYCTQLLADLGAEVIKIETPRVGDYARMVPKKFGGEAAYRVFNRGKKSLALNYRNPRGREIFLRLAESADVVFETFRPGLVKRWGIDYEAVRAVNPGIVYCSLSGYGQDGPYRDRTGHDLNYVGLSGLLAVNGPPGGPPLPLAVQIGDLGGGLLAATAITAALVKKALTGAGDYLDVGIFDLAISWAGPEIGSLYFAAGQEPGRGRVPLSGGLACYNVYETAGGEYVTLAALEPPLWATFCKRLGREDLISRQFEEGLIPEIAALFKERSREAWLEFFADLEVCLEPVISFREMLDHPQVRHRGLVLGMEGNGQEPVVGSPFQRGSTGEPAPQLGEHTRDLLAGAGCEPEELGQLEADGVIRLG